MSILSIPTTGRRRRRVCFCSMHQYLLFVSACLLLRQNIRMFLDTVDIDGNYNYGNYNYYQMDPYTATMDHQHQLLLFSKSATGTAATTIAKAKPPSSSQQQQQQPKRTLQTNPKSPPTPIPPSPPNASSPSSSLPSSCRQHRPCPQGYINKVVFSQWHAAGLNDRAYTIHKLSNLAGFLCATLHFPSPADALLGSGHNWGIPQSVVWKYSKHKHKYKYNRTSNQTSRSRMLDTLLLQQSQQQQPQQQQQQQSPNTQDADVVVDDSPPLLQQHNDDALQWSDFFNITFLDTGRPALYELNKSDSTLHKVYGPEYTWRFFHWGGGTNNLYWNYTHVNTKQPKSFTRHLDEMNKLVRNQLVLVQAMDKDKDKDRDDKDSSGGGEQGIHQRKLRQQRQRQQQHEEHIQDKIMMKPSPNTTKSSNTNANTATTTTGRSSEWFSYMAKPKKKGPPTTETAKSRNDDNDDNNNDDDDDYTATIPLKDRFVWSIDVPFFRTLEFVEPWQHKRQEKEQQKAQRLLKQTGQVYRSPWPSLTGRTSTNGNNNDDANNNDDDNDTDDNSGTSSSLSCDYVRETVPNHVQDTIHKVLQRVRPTTEEASASTSTTTSTTSSSNNNNHKVGLFHIRRGDTIQECDTTLHKIASYVSCSFSGLEKAVAKASQDSAYSSSSSNNNNNTNNKPLLNITVLFASDEQNTTYRHAVQDMIRKENDKIKLQRQQQQQQQQRNVEIRVVDLDELLWDVVIESIHQGDLPLRVANNFFIFRLQFLLLWTHSDFQLLQRRGEDCRECDAWWADRLFQ